MVVLRSQPPISPSAATRHGKPFLVEAAAAQGLDDFLQIA
jgi:hypothetical protein